MKRILYACTMVLLLTGCSQTIVSTKEEPKVILETTEQLLMANDVLYRNTHKKSTFTPSCGTMDGQITSTIEKDEIPKENGQANFKGMYMYQFGDKLDELIVFMDDELITFEKWDKQTKY